MYECVKTERFLVAKRDCNDLFCDKYMLSYDSIRKILLGLKVSHYKYTTKNTNSNYPPNNLFVFKWINCRVEEFVVDLYIKIDLHFQNDNDFAVVISLHEDENEAQYV